MSITSRFLPSMIALFLTVGSVSQANSFFVSPDGSNMPPFDSWATAANDIQSAVDAASDGDTVLVDDGIYLIAQTIKIKNGISVLSLNGSSSTTIDGQGVTRCVTIDHPQAVLDGFTVQNGYNPGGFGGAVNIVNGGTVQGCVLRNSQARDGGGVAIDNDGLVYKCVITGNLASDNGSSGYGGGVRLYKGGTARGCLIMNNESIQYGGGVNIWDAGRVESCTIVSNKAPNGAGIRTRSKGIVLNTILYYNVGANWELNGSGYAYTNCCTTDSGSLPGANNISANPLFVNPAKSAWRLKPNSPCIDAGLNQGWMTGEADIYGKDRILNGTVDIGASECLAHQITATAGANGTVSPAGVVAVLDGANRRFTITPNTGYAIQNVWVDDTPVGPLASVLFEKVDADHVLHAAFTPATWRKADFIVTSIATTPAKLVPGGTFSATVTVKNVGYIDGYAGMLKVWSSHTAWALPGEAADAFKAIGTLAPGESKTLKVTGLTAPADPGTYHFRAFADGHNVTDEQSEGNNQRTLTYTFLPSAPVLDEADFKLDSIVFTPSTLTPGGTFRAAVTIKNVGTKPGNAGRVRVWLHQPIWTGPGTPGDVDKTGGSLEVGESKTITFYGLVAPPDPGTYHFRAFVDADNAVPESNEGNNQKSLTYTFLPPAPVLDEADFKLDSIVFTPSTLTPGGTFRAAVTIKNVGTKPGNAGRVRVWLHQPIWTAPGTPGDVSKWGGSLEVGESKTITFYGLVAPTDPGTYHFRAFVDANNAVSESNEGNNQKSLIYTFLPPTPVLDEADLKLDSIVFTPSTLTTGGTFRAAVTITNVGTKPGNAGRVRVWLHQPIWTAPGTPGDADKTGGLLEIGESKTITFYGLVAPTVPGTYHFRAFVDADNAVPESNEGDNQKSLTYTFLPPF